VVYLIAQLADGWLVEPVVQGKATNLDPLTVMLAVIIGGSLAGLLGMLLAIPFAACGKILAREVILPELRQFAEGIKA
jgi:predicted PurR-regulated permease PerM